MSREISSGGKEGRFITQAKKLRMRASGSASKNPNLQLINRRRQKKETKDKREKGVRRSEDDEVCSLPSGC